MKGITALALLATLQLGLVGCARQRTYCRCDSNSSDVSIAPKTRTSGDGATDPFVPEVEVSPSDSPAAEAPAEAPADAPAAAAPAASDEAAEQTGEPAARTATRRDTSRRLIPSQSPQYRGGIEG